MSPLFRLLSRAALIATAFGSAGCFEAVPWSSHTSLRMYGRAHVSNVDPEEPFVARVTPDRHHVTLTLDSFFLRNIPGVAGGGALVGLEVRGAGPSVVSLPLGSVAAQGKHGYLTSLRAAPAIGPFLYKGAPLEVTVSVRPGSAASISCSGTTCASAAALTPAAVDPADEATLAVLRSQFQALFPATEEPTKTWRYTFTLTSSADKATAPDAHTRMLTAQTHLLLLSPPALAPARLQAVQPGKVVRYLTRRGARLHWLHDDREFASLPYLVFSVARSERNPSPSKALQAALGGLVKACDPGPRDPGNGAPPEQRTTDAILPCRPALQRARVTLEQEPSLSMRERSFYTKWLELRDAQQETHSSERDGDKDKQLYGYLAQLARLGELGRQYTGIMTEEEVRYLSSRADDTFSAAKRLCVIVGKEPARVEAAYEQSLAATKEGMRAARMEELVSLKLAAKYDTAKASTKKPPAELLAD